MWLARRAPRLFSDWQIRCDLVMVNSTTAGKVLSPISLGDFKNALFKLWLPSLPPTRIGSSLFRQAYTVLRTL